MSFGTYILLKVVFPVAVISGFAGYNDYSFSLLLVKFDMTSDNNYEKRKTKKASQIHFEFWMKSK